jgi:hypothetical protein
MILPPLIVYPVGVVLIPSTSDVGLAVSSLEFLLFQFVYLPQSILLDLVPIADPFYNPPQSRFLPREPGVVEVRIVV